MNSLKRQVGLGLRKAFYHNVINEKSDIPWFEIISENFMGFGGKPLEVLLQVRERHLVAMHGVGLTIGSLEPINIKYLRSLAALVNVVRPLWVSDHLCWTAWQSKNSHDLLPVPYTFATLDRIVDKLKFVQDLLGRRYFLENPSAYIQFAHSDMSEPEFIAEMCHRSGCGLMLDLNNIIVTHYNLGINPISYLDTIRSCPVEQIHLAGHQIKDRVRIDTHDQPLSSELFDLIPHAMKIWPNANPMIEWDEQIPDYKDLRLEVLRVQKLIDMLSDSKSSLKKECNSSGLGSENAIIYHKMDASVSASSFDIEKMRVFWKDMMETNLPSLNFNSPMVYQTDLPTPALIGMQVYNSAYFLRIRDVLKANFPTLFWACEDFFDDLVWKYISRFPSQEICIDFIGRRLPEFLETYNHPENEVENKILADVSRFEWALLSCYVTPDKLEQKAEPDWYMERKTSLSNDCQIITCKYPIASIYESVRLHSNAEVPSEESTYYLIYRELNEVHWKKLSHLEFRFTCLLDGTRSVTDALMLALLPTEEKTEDLQDQIQDLLVKLSHFFRVRTDFSQGQLSDLASPGTSFL